MKEHPRYRIVSEIARGEFATVYKGVDRELEREVAIKQIHDQYLSDPSELDRYWREAQLMAKLQHPYVMTIYDIVRDRGWLILELAQGSLKQRLAGKPIDIEDLRLTLIYMTQALQFLSRNGIVHGDVKPTNLLLDRNHRIKLGDFGIARHLAHSEGSVVKGTTKYMAPEVISDQFGSVGPHSDIYSLGFAAYELLCGEHFESLFPGLNMFGRDAQVAWMMWHTSLDRRLPDINRVLDGVPQDLARVIQKMIEKDPAKRYRNADQVLFDLKASHEGKDADALRQEEATKAEAEKTRTRKRRIWLYAALAASMLLTLAMVFIPSGSPAPIATGPQIPAEARIEMIDLQRREIVLAPNDNNNANNSKVALLVRDVDELTLNGQDTTLDQLAVGDSIAIKDGATFRVLKVTRSQASQIAGSIVRVDANNGRLEIESPAQERLAFAVPSGTQPSLNGRNRFAGRSLQLVDLRPGDSVNLTWHVDGEEKVATLIEAERSVRSTGTLEKIEPGQRSIWVNVPDEDEPLQFSLAEDALTTLNGINTLANGQVFGLADLRAGDAIEFEHTRIIHSLDASRSLVVAGVIRDFELDRSQIQVELDNPPRIVAFKIDNQTTLVETGREDSQPRPSRFLQRGDLVEITHTSVDLVDPVATKIEFTAVKAKDRWALVIVADATPDPKVSELPHAAVDGKRLTDAFTDWYRLTTPNLVVLQAPTKLQTLQALDQIASQIQANDQLVVYFVGHGYFDSNREPWLATAELEFDRMADTGLSLRELIKRFESIEAAEKILLLETGHESAGSDRNAEPATAELVEALKRSPSHPVSTSVHVFAGNAAGQRGATIGAGKGSVFTEALALAYESNADRDRDGRVSPQELANELSPLIANLATSANAQSLVQFVPDATPPRLSETAVAAVSNVMAQMQLTRYDEAFLDDYNTALAACQDQPDADLAFAIVNLKHNRTADARRYLERVTGRWPDEPSAHLALAWQNALTRRYTDTWEHLQALAAHLPIGPQHNTPQELAWSESAAELIGVCREFAQIETTEVGWLESDLLQLDATAQSWPESVAAAYQVGRNRTRERFQALQLERNNAEGAALTRIDSQLTRINTYGDLNLDAWRDYLRFRLDD